MKSTPKRAISNVRVVNVENPVFKIHTLIRESLPNFKAVWCNCDDESFEDAIRYMDDDACACGVAKHHVHRVKCGHVTQIG